MIRRHHQLACITCITFLLAISPATAADSAQALYLSASQAERAGETAKAMAIYGEIISRYPYSPLAINATDKLTENTKINSARAEAKNQEERRATEMQREALQQELEQRNSRRQSLIQNCKNQENQCRNICSMKYASYDGRRSVCNLGCDSQQCIENLWSRPDW